MPGPNSFHRLVVLSCLALLIGCSTKGTNDIQGRAFSAGPNGEATLVSLDAQSETDQDLNTEDETAQGDELAGETEVIPQTEQTLETNQTIDQELAALATLGKWEAGRPPATIEDKTSYDFPVTINRQVEFYIDFFQNEKHKIFARWLARSTAYLPMIHEQLRQAGLPQDLAYLAMIESGFQQAALSPASALGMWQFISTTARDYDLKVNSSIDERLNPAKATRAAVEHLSDLYAEFGSWYLAVAAYNAGAGKISRAIAQQQSNDFWELASGSYLALETKRYVPQLIAAIILAKNPEKYGFDSIPYQSPPAVETIEVPARTALKAVSLACDVDMAELWDLNRELRKPVCPPDNPSCQLNVPAGKKQLALRNLPRVQVVVNTQFKTHIVGKKENLDLICKKYNVTRTTILKANNLQSAKLSAGLRLQIPYQTSEYKLLPEGSVAGRIAKVDRGGSEKLVYHKVKPGETISTVAKLYKVEPQAIAGWNNLKDASRVKAGQQLVIHVEKGGEPTAVPFAAPAASNRVAAKTTEAAPAPSRAAEIKAGQLKQKVAAATPRQITYQVQDGDTLWTIARKFNLVPNAIKQWNNLKDDVIHPGSRLVLILADVDA